MCVVDEKVRLSVSPQGQDICLLTKIPVGKAMETIIVKKDKINIFFQKVTKDFTRCDKMEAGSSKSVLEQVLA